MKPAPLSGEIARTLFVFFVCALLFSAILRIGGDLVPADAGAALTLVLACLLTWIDARCRERKRAAKVASGILPERFSSVPAKEETSSGNAVRTIFVFFFWLILLSLILHVGLGLDPSGDEEFDRLTRVHFQVSSLKIPAEWVVPPFVYISAGLLTWIDTRQRKRTRPTWKYKIPWAKVGRNLLVFFISLYGLGTIFWIGIGVGPFGEEDFGEGIWSYHEFRSLRVRSELVVPPFIFVSSILIAWLDSRRMERREATPAK